MPSTPGMEQDLGVTDEHEALADFLGDSSATGTAYGADLTGTEWRSVYSARWHSGE
ncbi:hypothetical protein EDF36_2471 [Rathayibacter sp. PhB152]|nr:hypothetical protein EDF36_2471 [Rathayibacter sp. PhB152]